VRRSSDHWLSYCRAVHLASWNVGSRSWLNAPISSIPSSWSLWTCSKGVSPCWPSWAEMVAGRLPSPARGHETLILVRVVGRRRGGPVGAWRVDGWLWRVNECAFVVPHLLTSVNWPSLTQIPGCSATPFSSSEFRRICQELKASGGGGGESNWMPRFCEPACRVSRPRGAGMCPARAADERAGGKCRGSRRCRAC
jgi:hypothetical protein